MSSRRQTRRSKQEQLLSAISYFKDRLVVNGSIVSPDNDVFSKISRKVNSEMSATAVYEFVTQNKVALAKYGEWGVCDESKENKIPVSNCSSSQDAEELRLEDEMKFMENFDPEKSKREQRKLNRKISNVATRKSVYDEKGIHVKTGLDLCDCLNDKCEGCFFPCTRCRSTKCGHECRTARRWMYETHTIQGMDEIIQNQYLDH
ncbi:ARL14 effector protein-like isoform X3 [Macrosteles quadrilineatus]|uniref:ARL14 effector protein-like isoform X4 n=1 Tax=Macrosteles quadrilineatus TaxID=74068 RepID=UPI0023E2E965|nr:ARL14 effector protein-like isoform X4 [Macrosteles quadrilineatus]XP_054262306.1 ARL14 effector protein-like isoform X3 [Macrosteles quadrilineatus]